MGWGLGWEMRNSFLDKGGVLRYTKSVTDREFKNALCAIDFNAAARSQAIGSKPPVLIARQLLKVAGFNNVQRNRLAIFCDNDQIPALRLSVHEQRAKRVSKRVPVPLPKLRSGTSIRSLGQYEWADLWGTVGGKRYGIGLLAEAMQHEIKAASWDGCEAAMTLPYNTDQTWSLPFDGSGSLPVPCPAYGEAEAQLVMYIEKYVATGMPLPILILTIDTDILLQTMCLHLPKTYVLIATVWAVEPKSGDKRKRITDTFHRTKKSATKELSKDTALVKYNEYVSCGAIRRYLGPSVVETANAMLWMLLAARVDYNASLGSFGWNSQTCLAQATKPTTVIKSMSRSCTVVDTVKLFNALRITRDRRRRDKDVAAFVKELNLTLYCLSYYLWYDDSRAVPGPVLTPYFVEDASSSIFEYLTNSVNNRLDVIITNLHPSQPLVRTNKFARSHAEFIALGANR
mgnify:CR=1 FL=1